jgi:hypothetical protein
MPYVPPTSDDFLIRFPIFTGTNPALITQLLDEAGRVVDDTWIEADRKPATMYLAAHMLALDNSAEGDEVEIGAGAGEITATSFGGMSVSFADGVSAGGVAQTGYSLTAYGRRFYALLRANRPGAMVV